MKLALASALLLLVAACGGSGEQEEAKPKPKPKPDAAIVRACKAYAGDGDIDLVTNLARGTALEKPHADMMDGLGQLMSGDYPGATGAPIRAAIADAEKEFVGICKGAGVDVAN